jgi:hypothetical protein
MVEGLWKGRRAGKGEGDWARRWACWRQLHPLAHCCLWWWVWRWRWLVWLLSDWLNWLKRCLKRHLKCHLKLWWLAEPRLCYHCRWAVAAASYYSMPV